MSKCILVLEDQEDNCQILRDVLCNAGYKGFAAPRSQRQMEGVGSLRRSH